MYCPLYKLQRKLSGYHSGERAVCYMSNKGSYHSKHNVDLFERYYRVYHSGHIIVSIQNSKEAIMQVIV
jgi:hypothetical protein